MRVLIIGDISNDVLEPKNIYNLDNPENSEMDVSKGCVVDKWDAYVVGDAIYLPSQYNIKTSEIIFQKGMVEPEPEPTPIEQLQSENNVLGQTAAELSLQNMQLNTALDTLGESLAQAQLDIMTFKGGAS